MKVTDSDNNIISEPKLLAVCPKCKEKSITFISLTEYKEDLK